MGQFALHNTPRPHQIKLKAASSLGQKGPGNPPQGLACSASPAPEDAQDGTEVRPASAN